MPSSYTCIHINGYHCPFLYEIFSARDFHGIECALWPSLYHTTVMGESVLEEQTNWASSKLSYMCKVLSPVLDYALSFEQLYHQCDRWLFKMILQKHLGAPLTEVWGTNHSRTPTGSTKICISSTQSGSLVIHPFSLPLAPMNGLYHSHHSLKTCTTTSMVKMLQSCPFWKPFLLPMSSSRSQGDTLPGEIATGGIPTSLQMPHIPTQATWRPTSLRLGR